MNKSELIDAMAIESGLTKVDAKKALDAFMSVTGRALKGDDKLALLGFGTFSVVERPERMGHNPSTGASIKIAASKVVKFKAGSELSELVK